MRRLCTGTAAARFAAVAGAVRAYRIMPHIYNEVEELAETQKAGRWSISHKLPLHNPLRRAEAMCEHLNSRERRRNGTLPDRAQARMLSCVYQKDGEIHVPHYKAKLITITIIGFDGHPYHIRTHPLPELNLNMLMEGCGMMLGLPQYFTPCENDDCVEFTHGEGCMVNVDLETLDRLLPPSRWEYTALTTWRHFDRPDVVFNTRFSCQIPITPELDGAVFACKQIMSRSLVAKCLDWDETDTLGAIGLQRSMRVEPWAPMIEEPTKRQYALTPDLFWAESYQDFRQREGNYKRRDGFHSRPEFWAAYV